MFSEDLSVFFADFGISAVWVPTNGTQQQTAQVILDTEGTEIQFGEFSANGSNISITYRATDFIGLAVNEPITINTTTFRVRAEPLEIEGGAMRRAWLGKYEE